MLFKTCHEHCGYIEEDFASPRKKFIWLAYIECVQNEKDDIIMRISALRGMGFSRSRDDT